MNCENWINKTSLLIREEKWLELIEQQPICYFDRKYLIEMMFIKEGKFSINAQDVALYLNKNKNLKWAEAIMSCRSPLSMGKLIDVVEAGLIDVNYSSYNSFAGTFLCQNYVPYWKEAIEYLFSKGCSVDIQDEDGCNLLLVVNYGWNTFKKDDHNYEMTKFLLECGTDTLLEDKQGYNIISYCKDFFSTEDQERFFALVNELEF